jgi:maltooligosyltrehalose synthase
MAKELDSIKAMVTTNGQAHKRTAAFAQESKQDAAMAVANRLASEQLAKKNPHIGKPDYQWRNDTLKK